MTITADSKTHLHPYGEYRDSGIDWLGPIPSHWTVRPLFVHFRETEIKNVGNHVQTVLSLSYGRIVPRNVESNVGLMPESFETYQVVDPGDVVLRLTDLQNDQRSLRVGFVETRGIVTSAYVNLRPEPGLEPRFAYYLLNSYDILKVFYGLGAGVRQTMKFADLRRLPILLPSPAEQRAIADYLRAQTAKIDALIEKQEHLIERLEEKRTALISHSVTKGLNPNVRTKDSGVEWLGEIPETWSVVRLKWCTSHIVDCLHATPTYSEDGEFPAVRTADVSLGRLDLSEAKRVNSEEYLARIQRLKPQALDIVYSREGERFGHAALVPSDVEVCVSQRMMHFRARADVDPAFLMWALNADGTYRQATLDSIGSTAPHVNVETIRNFMLAIPPVKDAQSIADHIRDQAEDLDSAEQRIGLLIKALHEKRTALISAAVTGKIDVREVA